MARKKWILASTALVVAVAGGGFAVTAQSAADGKGDRQQNEGLPPDTVPVVEGDLSNSVQADGTLGHARERKINAGTPGTLTKIAGEGTPLSGASASTRSTARRSACCTAPRRSTAR